VVRPGASRAVGGPGHELVVRQVPRELAALGAARIPFVRGASRTVPRARIAAQRTEPARRSEPVQTPGAVFVHALAHPGEDAPGPRGRVHIVRRASAGVRDPGIRNLA
jgi:hypothetical protein